MKKTNKKGFTIVELVIVIAVIAILAGVMIPTFGGIIKTAQESNEMQKITALYKEAYALAIANDGSAASESKQMIYDEGEKADDATDDTTITFAFAADGSCKACVNKDTGFNYAFADGKWTATKLGTNDTRSNVHNGTAETACTLCGVKG